MDCLLGNKLELAERCGVLLSRLHVALDGYQAIYSAQVWLSEIGAGLTVTVRKKKSTVTSTCQKLNLDTELVKSRTER